ncbi:4-hydroxy-tetrahydrodipicolinate reductase [Catonella massiliensis]|uniref:4-hydroxy-tetrahydrodipicolinate reductase n=1 Tax=Catonella massiliensis TaxID=2799636 RepID=A0ABS1J006_9FIRM|nr:4-hydroxy-tetrahydrodipicolinate reductase [Catonella massiliensis]MBK5897462.1 4-hydroxy-tetrahydrodipicolinate reductase [Catonella massiliensis]
MVEVILHGCNGRMGQMLSELISKDEEMKVVAGIEPSGEAKNDYPVYKSFDELKETADVIIDFSTASAIDGLLDYCEKTHTPLVLCSTGLSEAQLGRVERLAKVSAVLVSANMSLGINVLLKLLKNVTKTLYENGFDIEIVEKHHNQKLDAPSGTALALADVMKDELDDISYNLDRSKVRKKRERNEIGISAVRGGTIVGEHEVIFAGTDEVIEIKHTAYSRAIFAKGAMSAAKFLSGKSAGKYSMSDVIG